MVQFLQSCDANAISEVMPQALVESTSELGSQKSDSTS